MKLFAEAALARDQHGQLLAAFRLTARGLIALMAAPPAGLLGKLSGALTDPDLRELRRRIWAFTRAAETGLPSSRLAGASAWLPALQARVCHLLQSLQQDFGLDTGNGLNRRLTRAQLPAGPLAAQDDVPPEREQPQFRIQTVHQVKGESIDAVLYVAKAANVQALLAGVDSEVGRIGYVALTRARNLFWLAVPSNALDALRPRLLEAGFDEARLAR